PAKVPTSAQAAASGIRVTTAAPWDEWWKVFHDPELERLVKAARAENQDLRGALARVQAARAVVGEAYGPLFPQVGAGADHAYYQDSKNANPTNTSAGTPHRLFAWSADAGYELDLFG